MSVWYLDTSVALKLLIEEAESPALAEAVDSEQPDLVASWLLEAELRRAAQGLGMLGMAAISDFLTGVSLYEMPGSSLREAGILPGETLRSLDALHLAAAVRVGVDLVLTHDERMAESAQQLRLRVLSPG
ncbi:MAG: type II toxin-antitoxin system VapC family toxin [Actinobacteria bacterium]|nr:type II toxin-antitoxin system VapC family toxin [Micrococcales bacterium]MCB0904877.1 type II toxin-antitoxin system VapC family toxin [Actinomycetota bacterium]MCO5299369.1 type II toxin-antitoxin system VapC family toxin [Candidatus Nanopelagicales bacterium]MCB9427781.1 type II toxin-antitoxin system VapC family toxin [Actinomycetota bacterium]HPE13547.1 type II toxin-antitoxin system VapC family toxin [Actinomycetota bacterium]